jgi:subtilisin family serine protease
MHGSAVGRLGIPDDGSFVECRSAGISSLVLVFSEPIAPSSLTPSGIVVQGADANGQGVDLSGIIITTSTSDGDTRGIITFSSALPNRASYLVRVTGVTSPKGAVLTGDEDRVLTALEGDVNGDFVVDQADMDVVKAIVGAEPGYQQWNFRADLNGDGMISARDRRVILNRKGSQIARPTIQQQASAAPPAAEPATTTDHTGAEASGDISDQAAYAYSAVMVGDGAGVAQDWTVSLSAAIDRPDDIDWFRLTAPVSGTLEVQTDYAQAAGTPYVTLYEVRRDGTVSLLQLEDRGSGRASTTAVAGRQYYLEVRRDSAGQAWLDRAGYGLNLKLSQFDDYLVQTQMDLVLADMPYRGEGYSVAVIDTGIDYRHPDLAGRVILGPDLADRDSDPMDTVDHGTHVAGIIAGSNPHAPGIAGKAKVIAVKVTHDGERSTTIALVGQALQWVLDNQSKYNIAAVNLSLGGGNADKGAVVEGLEGLYAQLTARGVFISAAAGNAYAQYGVEGLSILATSENVAAVGAVWDSNVGPAAWVGGARDYTTAPDRVVSFSQRGEGLDLLAPGGDILNLRAGGGLTVKSGTSMASPMVAAASVLLREASDELHLLSFQAVGSLAINSDSSMGSPMASGTWPLLRQGDDGVHLQLTPQAMLEILRVTGKTVWDGDDENDNVPDTGRAYRRLDVLAALTALPLELTPPLGIPLTDNVP